MDYKVLIEDLKNIYENYISDLCGNDKMNCADLCIASDCIIVQAIEAFETVLKERDVAIKMLYGECNVCKHNAGWHNIGKCITCKHENAATFLPEDCGRHVEDNWEWKGLKDNLCQK